jgi:hypothetical protein
MFLTEHKADNTINLVMARTYNSLVVRKGTNQLQNLNISTICCMASLELTPHSLCLERKNIHIICKFGYVTDMLAGRVIDCDKDKLK